MDGKYLYYKCPSSKKKGNSIESKRKLSAKDLTTITLITINVH